MSSERTGEDEAMGGDVVELGSEAGEEVDAGVVEGSAEASPGNQVPEPAPETPLTVLVYASDRATREHVRLSLGRRVARDLPSVRVVEVATQPAVITAMDAGGIDLAILDGEAVPGGMGLCRQLKHELRRCPPILVLTGRRDDAWLATWSLADGVLPHPVDPVRLPETVAALLRAEVAPATPPAPVEPGAVALLS